MFSFRLTLYVCHVKREKNLCILLGIRSGVLFSGDYQSVTTGREQNLACNTKQDSVSTVGADLTVVQVDHAVGPTRRIGPV